MPEMETRTEIQHEPKDCTDPECRWNDHPGHKHARVEIHHSAWETMNKQHARIADLEGRLARYQDALRWIRDANWSSFGTHDFIEHALRVQQLAADALEGEPDA